MKHYEASEFQQTGLVYSCCGAWYIPVANAHFKTPRQKPTFMFWRKHVPAENATELYSVFRATDEGHYLKHSNLQRHKKKAKKLPEETSGKCLVSPNPYNIVCGDAHSGHRSPVTDCR